MRGNLGATVREKHFVASRRRKFVVPLNKKYTTSRVTIIIQTNKKVL